MKFFVVVTMAITLSIVFTIPVFGANNPADLTASYRSFVAEYFKIGYDGGPCFALVNLPVGSSMNVFVIHWQDKESKNRSSEITVVKRFASWLDAASDVVFADGAPTHKIVLDLHWKTSGLGLMFPLEKGGVVSIGPRLKAKAVTCYLATSFASGGAENFYGLSVTAKNANIDVAYSQDKKTVFVRAQMPAVLPIGTVIPELRTQFSNKEKVLGFGIGFIPKK